MTIKSHRNAVNIIAIFLVGAILGMIFACGGGGGSGGEISAEALATPMPEFEAIPAQNLIDSYKYEYQLTPKNASASGLTYEVISGPEGLTITEAGILVWTPTLSQVGEHAATVVVTDSFGRAQNIPITLAVTLASLNTPPIVQPIPAQTADMGNAFTYQISATDPHTPLVYGVESGPDGLTVTSAGLIAWTPSPVQTGEVFRAVIVVADRYGFISRVEAAISVGNAAPAISTIEDQTATIGTDFVLDHVVAADRDQPLTYALVNNPAGMTINTNGVISWTPTVDHAGTTQTITVKVTDSRGLVSEMPMTLETLNISPIVEDIPDQNSVSGQPFSYQVVATDANTISYSLAYGPSGLAIDSTGKITWTCGTPNSYAVGIKVADNLGGLTEKAFVIFVTNGAPTVDAIPDDTAAVDVLKSIQVTASDPNTPLSYTLNNNPVGMTIDSAGLIKWSPVAAQEGATYSNVSVTVSDAFALSTTVNFNIVVNNRPPTVLTVPNQTLDVYDVFAYNVVASDTNAPLSYSLQNAPSTMTIDSNGLISWTVPSTDQGRVFNITVRVADGHATNPLYTDKIFSVTINNIAPTITAIPEQFASQNAQFRLDVSQFVTDPNTPLIYTLTAVPTILPAMTIDTNGVISWTPTAAGGPEPVTVEVFDSFGLSSTKTFNITVNAGVTITTNSLPNSSVGDLYIYRLAAVNGALPTPSYTWSLPFGALPTGLTLDTATGFIYGEPSAIGTYNFTVRVTDANNGGSTNDKAFTIVINSIAITTRALPEGTANLGYLAGLEASGGTTPYTWSLVGGSLPTGLTLSPGGTIYGTAVSAGTSQFEVELTDANLFTATKTYTLKINTDGTMVCTPVSVMGGKFIRPITVTGSGTDLTDYQVEVSIDWDSDMQADFDDIRFYSDMDGTTPLTHWRESYTASDSAVFWVKIPSIPIAGTTIYMFHGNPAVSSLSDGPSTFLFFDDFDTIDTGKWEITRSLPRLGTDGSRSVLILNVGGVWAKNYALDQNCAVEIMIKSLDTTSEGVMGVCDADGKFDKQMGEGDLKDGFNVLHWSNGSYYAEWGDGTTHGESSRKGYNTSWNKAVMKYKSGTEVKFEYLGDTYTRGVNIPPIANSIHPTMNFGKGGAHIDYYFIRKYSDPEPASTVGAKMTLGSTGTFAGKSDTFLIPEGAVLGTQRVVGSYYYKRRAPITVTGSGVAQTDYTVQVTIPYDSDMQTDFDDIAFTAADGTTELSYWRESYNPGITSVFWVKIPSIPIAGTTIYVYYGHSTKKTGGDGKAAFVYYEDFSKGTYTGDDPWTVSAGAWTADSKYLAGSSDDGVIMTDNQYTAGEYFFKMRQTGNYSNDDYANWYFRYLDSTHYLRLEMRTYYPSSTSYYWLRLYYRNGGGEVQIWQNTSYNWYNESVAGNWFYFKVQLYPGTLRYKVWRTDQAEPGWTGTYANPINWGETGYVRIYSYRTGDGDGVAFDDARFRKYANPEPVATLGAEEVIPMAEAATSGSATTCEINPTSISAWGELSFSDIKASNGGPLNTDVKYQVQYWDGNNWVAVPDGILAEPPTNSAGYVAPPVDLSALNVVTYRKLRILATFSSVDGSATPTVYSIKVTWTP